jgi:hypothetical protein
MGPRSSFDDQDVNWHKGSAGTLIGDATWRGYVTVTPDTPLSTSERTFSRLQVAARQDKTGLLLTFDFSLFTDLPIDSCSLAHQPEG